MSDYILGYDVINQCHRAISLADGPEIVLDIEEWREQIRRHIADYLENGTSSIENGLGFATAVGIPDDILDQMRSTAGRSIGNSIEDMRASLQAEVVLKYDNGHFIPLKNPRVVSVQEALALAMNHDQWGKDQNPA